MRPWGLHRDPDRPAKDFVHRCRPAVITIYRLACQSTPSDAVSPQPNQEAAMSIEFELQKYPKDIKLKDGSVSKLRPLRKDDQKAFHEFFSAVPEPERMFIKHRVTD